jgi:hypothetical protein
MMVCGRIFQQANALERGMTVMASLVIVDFMQLVI